MARSADIVTSRLRITPFSLAHITPRYLSWLNDKELMRYSEQRHRSHTPESCQMYLQSFEDTPHYFWAIEEPHQGLGHIGNINAYVNEQNQLADMGIVVGERKAQGKGYALEAWQAVCVFLFGTAGLRKLTAGAMVVNTPMLNMMRRSGMAEDGVRQRHYLCDGQEVDIIHMALFRPLPQAWSPLSNNGKS